MTDVANKEQLSLAVRFVDIDGTIHEEFLGFLSLERITGEAIASAILDVLPKWNLNIKNCRGQGYDGASNMSLVRRGTQVLLLEECPLAVYTQCRAHCLNSAIVHSCDQPLIRSILGTLKETCDFFKYSPKRNNLLLSVIEKDSPHAKKTTLKNMCKTQWAERHEAYEVFFALFSCIMRVLEVIANERLFAGQYGDAAWSWDTDTKDKASGLANAISSFSFIITLLTAMKCLSVLKPLSVRREI